MKIKKLQFAAFCLLGSLPLAQHLSAAENESNNKEIIYQDVTTGKVGTLAEVLGENIETVDSLVVRGQINEADFNTLWEGTYYHNLKVINLEYAEIENSTIPKYAFWHNDIQYNSKEQTYTYIGLKRIILPDNLKKIDDFAFYCAENLEKVNIPKLSPLGIGDCIFDGCVNLEFDNLIIPEGVKRVGGGSFSGCQKVKKVTLPSTLEIIGVSAFSGCGLTSVNLPEGVVLQQGAFANSGLIEVFLPASCSLEDLVFAYNKNLKKFEMQEGRKGIPMRMLSNCPNLEEIYIPSTVTTIGIDAFRYCSSIKNIELPEGLKTISQGALDGLESLEEVVFYSDVKLDGDCCAHWKSIKRIYSTSPEPPECVGQQEIYPQYTPFGDKNAEPGVSAPRDTPVYVPIGSAEKYRTAKGWDYFTNFIETDEFPQNGVVGISAKTPKGDETIYDIQGRKVNNPLPGQIYIQNGKKIIYLK